MKSLGKMRYDYNITYGEAARMLYLYPIVNILSLGLASPLTIRNYLKTIYSKKYSLGGTLFNLNISLSELYKTFGITILIITCIVSALALPLYHLYENYGFLIAPSLDSDPIIIVALGGLVIFCYIFIFVYLTYFCSKMEFLTYTNLKLGQNISYKSKLPVFKSCLVIIAYALLLILSLGLLKPFLDIWKKKYFTSKILVTKNILDLEANNPSINDLSVTASEFADFNHIDNFMNI